jgi:hypothetical protein
VLEGCGVVSAMAVKVKAKQQSVDVGSRMMLPSRAGLAQRLISTSHLEKDKAGQRGATSFLFFHQWRCEVTA